MIETNIKKYSVHQHWDPLNVCIVGQTYPPEYYQWIKISHVRKLFERIATETEEDYQSLISKLQEFGVEVVRPELPEFADIFINGQYMPPPMTPRDYMIMIGDVFYKGYQLDIKQFYNAIKSPSWPECSNLEEFNALPVWIRDECHNDHNFFKFLKFYSSYDKIFDMISRQGNNVVSTQISAAPGAYITRVGKDLYFGTDSYSKNQTEYIKLINTEFTNTRNHIINTGGHSDGTYCPVAPGLIISLNDVPTYADTFPGWEVVYLPGQSWSTVQPFLDLKQKNNGRWWIPGFEYDTDVVNVVESWLGHWTGYVEETVFDVNMLIIDPKNVIVFNYNQQVFDALARYGITPHVVPFRHRYFWDGGIHCVTTDLDRTGTMQDFFPVNA